MSLELTLQSAISGMQTSKAALQTISNNIANVNTEDYTRKIVEQKSRVFDGKGYGVEIGAITRRVNEGVIKQMRNEMGTLENISVKQDYLTQLNSFFGTPADDNSISHKIGDLGAQFNNLAVSPEISANHFLTVNSAEDTALALRRMSEEVQYLRTSANGKLNDTISKANTLLDEIVDSNSGIMTFTASQLSTAELEDQRDKSLNALAEIMDITYFKQNDGSYSVYSGSGQTLVTVSGKQTLSYIPPATLNASLEYTPTSAINYSGPTNSDYPIGGVPGIFVGEISASSDITAGVKSGSLKGLIDIRDHDLRAIQTQLDELAEKLKIEINKAHNKGTGFPPPQVLTGDNFVQGTTNISTATGMVIVSVVDKSGNKLETEYINLADANITNVTSLLTNGGNTGINDKFTATNLVASVTNGQLVLAAGNDNRVTINEMTSSMTGAGKVATGFSDFFGLNNLYQSRENFAIYRSDYKPNSSAAVMTASGTLQFTDATNGARSINYAANDTLTALATKISAATGVTAQVISDGDGFRLQVTQDDAEYLAIVETGAGKFLSETGLRSDTRGISSRLKVREDIVSNNSFISRGSLQSNSFSTSAQTSAITNFATLGGIAAGALQFTVDASTAATINYATTDSLTTVAASINANATLASANISAEVITLGANSQLKINNSKSDNFWIIDTGGLTTTTSQGISIGDGTTAANIAAQFDTQKTFLAAPASGGGLAQTTSTLNNYAASILSANSSSVTTLDQELTFQEQLTMELYNKHTSASGVNMDEELANMIIIEQSYLAAARIITTTQSLFKVLNDMMR